MKPSQVSKALDTLLDVRQPVFLWGAPGVGKSQLVAQAAQRRTMQLTDIRAVLLDPVDLRGVPRIADDGTTTWCPPSFLPRDGAGVLFLDELNAAPPLVQAACYQLILDRKVGEYELPDGWIVVAAGNRESDRAVTHRIPSALANRMVHLDLDADLDDWIDWAHGASVVEELVAFLRFRPKLLHAFDPKSGEKAFPSPRSWEFVSRILHSGPAQDILLPLLTGTVGQAAAAEFMGFLKVCRSVPDADAVLADPASVRIPDDPAVMFALCESVARRASGDTMPALTVLASRLPVEFGVLLMRDAAAVDPAVVETPSFGDWACANSDVLM